MDQNPIDFILIFPLSLLSFVFLLIFVNVFVFIRKKFPVKVNCWFCNQWTKVSYHSKDSFECPGCLQYNGFNEDGGYNKVLPAQYDVSSNRSADKRTSKRSSPSNGLCQLCNNNQKLRVFQLANFIPLDEANYDTEIEHFQKQLDKAYKLCGRCDNTVQTTIRKQNRLLGIDVRKGIAIMDLTQSTNGVSVALKWLYLKNFVFYSVTGLSILKVGYFLSQNVAFSNGFNQHVWVPLSPYFSKARDVYNCFQKDFISFPELFDLEQLRDHLHVADFLLLMEEVWVNVSDAFTSLVEMILFNATLRRTQFWLVLVEVLLQIIWFFINPRHFKKNILLLIVNIAILLFEFDYFSSKKLSVDTLSLPVSVLNVMLMWFSYNAVKTKSRKHSSKFLKKKTKHFVAVEENRHETRKETVTNVTDHNSYSNAFTSTAENQVDRPTENLFMNSDLDVSLNKLHIGTSPPKRSLVKTNSPSFPTLERPRPVLSPARFHTTPASTYETSTFSSPNTNDQFASPTAFGGFGYNSFYSPPPLCPVNARSPFNCHLGSYVSRYSCGEPFGSLINNEQLVYIAPDYLRSADVYELLKRNFSTDVFDAAFQNNVKKFENVGHNQFGKKFQ